jgi:hypothetical protein
MLATLVRDPPRIIYSPRGKSLVVVLAGNQLEEKHMKRGILFTLVALPIAFALPIFAIGSLAAPTGFTATLVDEVIKADWDDVTGAAKYSVNIVAEYDTNGDGAADMSVDFDFGTGDRTDGLPMSASSLDIPLAELEHMIDVNNDGVDEAFMPVKAQARVKALNPGKGKGRQDNPFCGFVTIFEPSVT